MLRTAARRPRPGFTLVELLVAAAVCVLIMAVLATAFQLGIDTMRQMKSTGEMMDQLRGAATALQADLKAPHLLDSDGVAKRLSEVCKYDNVTVVDNGAMAKPRFAVNNWSPPQLGFVRIGGGPITFPTTNADPDGLVNGTGIATNHFLHFTSVLNAQSDDDYFSATVNGKTFQSTAAELAYFLDPNPTGTTPGGTNLFRLVRRQRIVAVNDTDRRDRPWPTTADHAVISLRQPTSTTTFLSTMAEVTNPAKRLGGTRWLSSTVQTGAGYAPLTMPADDGLAPMASRPGEDTLLSNVISFEVQVLWRASSDPTTVKFLPPFGKTPATFNNTTGKTEAPFDTLPQVPTSGWVPATGTPPTLAGTNVFDSWTGEVDWTTNFDPTVTDGNRPPLLIRVQAVQIRIRIWDPKLQNARQLTIVQDL